MSLQIVQDAFLFTLIDSEYFEPLEHYRPEKSVFEEVAERTLGSDWRLDRHGVWVSCSRPGVQIPREGWKIHLSAIPSNAAAILTIAARVLKAEGVAFKFALDAYIHTLLNNKRWGRGGAGKFMTIYPPSEEVCARLLERLSSELNGYSGPYILSDRRYKNSKVVHYRYGGFVRSERMTVEGRRALTISTPDGTVVDDERNPYFQLPPGVTDPFDPQSDDDSGDGALKNGRYQVESVITFSNAGGVYVGLDTETGMKVLIKEARPFTHTSPQGTDAVALLRKEFRILKLLEESGVAPKPVDFFEDWEHWFLVEEYVEGETLRGFVNARGIALRIDPTIEEAREFYGIYRQLYAQVARHLEVLHQHHVIFTDMSHNNVIVSADGSTVRFIDFEGAREVGVDQPTSFYTPGFAPPELIAGRTARREDDSFGFGALMLAGLIPATDLMVLEPTSHLRLVEGFTRDLGLPADLGDAILKLMAADKSQRMPLLEAIRILEADTPVHAPTIGSLDPAPVDTAALLDRMMRHLKAVQTPQRRDRLFPASPELWATNPLSLAHGACGVAAVLQRVQGEVPAEVTDWILSHEVTTESYAPGLFLGMGGIAWALLDLGYGEAAARIGRASAEHPLLWESPDLYSGAAGWGLSQLKLALELRDDEFLRNAVRAGEFLLSTRLRDDETGASWWVNAGKESCNLGHGAAGVSLFLLYLYRATGDERYLEAGEEGLTYVLDRSLETFDGGMTWVIEEGHRTYTPYWRWGSAGIGMVLIRYLHATGDSRYSDALQKVMVDADRKYSIFPGRFGGLAGVGEFWLDLERFGYEPERARRGARKALEGVLMFRVEREAGTTFCGDSRMRVSCDYGSGSAGIAAFIHRLQTSAAPMFMLDDLLDDVSSRAIEIPNIEIASGAATIGA